MLKVCLSRGSSSYRELQLAPRARNSSITPQNQLWIPATARKEKKRQHVIGFSVLLGSGAAGGSYLALKRLVGLASEGSHKWDDVPSWAALLHAANLFHSGVGQMYVLGSTHVPLVFSAGSQSLPYTGEGGTCPTVRLNSRCDFLPHASNCTPFAPEKGFNMILSHDGYRS